MNLDKEITKKLENLVFIELKKDLKLKEDIILKREIPLPIKKSYLEKTIRENIDLEEIDIEKILDSMAYIVGIEEDFKYNNDYIKLIKKLLKNAKDYFMFKTYSNQEIDSINALIYIKAYNNIYEYNIDIHFKEINILENIYNKNFNDMDEVERETYLKKIINSYEYIIKEDVTYYLSYFRLAYIYLSMKKYIKSRLYFEKFLQYSENENLNTEVREELKEIEDYANIDAAKTYISYGKYQDAKETLEKISSLYPQKWELNFLFAQVYYNMEDYEKSKNYLEDSIREKISEENINLLALNHMNLENNSEAIEIYKLGIRNLENSYLLNYNLGVTYLNLNELDSAVEYLNRANEIKPNEDLEKIIDNLEKSLDIKK